MAEIDQKKKEEFLADLTALTKKHGVVIGGCGCCGSPFLFDVNDKAQLIGNERGEYTLTSDSYEQLTWS